MTGLGGKAQLALELCKHFSTLVSEYNGEDSSGRQKLRMMTPAEVTLRACAIADILFDEFTERGWVVKIPEAQC